MKATNLFVFKLDEVIWSDLFKSQLFAFCCSLQADSLVHERAPVCGSRNYANSHLIWLSLKYFLLTLLL